MHLVSLSLQVPVQAGTGIIYCGGTYWGFLQFYMLQFDPEVPWDKLLICKACLTMSAICLMPRWGAWRNSVLFCSLGNFTAVLYHSLQTAHVRGSKNVQYPIFLFQSYKNIIFILINTRYVFFSDPWLEQSALFPLLGAAGSVPGRSRCAPRAHPAAARARCHLPIAAGCARMPRREAPKCPGHSSHRADDVHC